MPNNLALIVYEKVVFNSAFTGCDYYRLVFSVTPGVFF